MKTYISLVMAAIVVTFFTGYKDPESPVNQIVTE